MLGDWIHESVRGVEINVDGIDDDDDDDDEDDDDEIAFAFEPEQGDPRVVSYASRRWPSTASAASTARCCAKQSFTCRPTDATWN